MGDVFILGDCNNFYVSCERAFDPKLERKPVVVLSNNDGCAVSRSQEAKDMAIKAGAPLYQLECRMDTHDIQFLSSNYALYGDMSQRVMAVLREFTPKVEVYSIDEAFMNIAGIVALQGKPPN
jgi:DNA polymerase V